MIRAFLALPLPDSHRDALHAVSFRLPLPRRVPPENYHLTLVFLGDVAEPQLEEAHYAFEAIHAPRFRLSLRGFGQFGNDKPRQVYAALTPEPALDRLQARAESAARRSGMTVQARRFVPHVTLGRYRPGEADAARLEQAVVEGAGFSLPPFEVDHFALYRSHLGKDSATYEELARYPLGPS